MKKLIKKFYNEYAYIYDENQGSYKIYIIPFLENSQNYKYFSQKCDNENDIIKLLSELIKTGAYNDNNIPPYDENLKFVFPYKK